MEVIVKKYWLILWVLIIFLGIFLRVYRLNEVPNGLYQDETAIGYNAYSILMTGKDEYSKEFPLYFKSFGDYKLPVYIYLTSVPVKIFGLNDVAPRIVSVLFSVATVGILFFFVRRLSQSIPLALFSMLLLSINPWHLHYGRATFEVSVALFFFTAGAYFLLGKNLKLTSCIIAVLCFLVALYSYNLTRLLAPLMLIILVFFNRNEFSKKSLNFKLILAAIFVIGLIPLFATFMGFGGLNSAKGTLITSSATIQARLLEMRSYLIYTPSFFQKIFFSFYPQTIWEYFRHILAYFSVDFFFISGSNHGNHGIGNFGLFYPIEVMSITVGIIVAFFKKKNWAKILVSWMVVVILVASLTREAPHATRSFFLVAPFAIFSAYGFLVLLKYIALQSKTLKIFLMTILFLIAGYGMVYYFASYYVRFPIAYAKNWNSEDKKVAEYVKEHESRFERIIVDSNSTMVYTSLLYYLKYSPSEFQRTVKRNADDSEGFSKVVSFGKFEFRKIDWEHDLQLEKTLFITTKDNIPDQNLVVEKLLYPVRPVVINIGQEIHQFPVTDVAYVLLEKN